MGHGFGGNVGQDFCTGMSRSSLPCSQSAMAAVAVIGFEIEPRRYNVYDVAGTEFSRSAMPKPADQTNSPSCTTAAETPGVWLSAMNFEMALSIFACSRLQDSWSELLHHSRIADTQEATRRLPRVSYISGAAVRHRSSMPLDSYLSPSLSRRVRPMPPWAASANCWHSPTHCLLPPDENGRLRHSSPAISERQALSRQ